MTCPACNYAMDAFDDQCPRCGGKGLSEPAAPARKATAAPAQAAPGLAIAVAQLSPAAAGAHAANKYADVDEDKDTWWQMIGGGLLAMLGSGWIYVLLTTKEASGGYIRTKWWIALIYSLGGKWLVCSLLAGVGAIAIALGIYIYSTQIRGRH